MEIFQYGTLTGLDETTKAGTLLQLEVSLLNETTEWVSSYSLP